MNTRQRKSSRVSDAGDDSTKTQRQNNMNTRQRKSSRVSDAGDDSTETQRQNNMNTRQRKSSRVSDAGDDSTERETQRQNNERVIEELEAEIFTLEQRLQQFRKTEKPVQQGGDESSTQTLDRVTEEIHELEQLVKENEILSGLTLTEVSSDVLEQDETSSLRQHSIVAETGGMQFKLQYDIREQFQKVDGKAQAEIVMLEMDVRDDMVTLLRTALLNVAADVNVRELFQLLASYGWWVEDRERAINHFVSTYPDIVHREDGTDEGCNMNMLISDPKRDLYLRVLWGLRVLPSKSVVPDLRLQVEASPEVLELDKEGTLEAAPEVFQLMLKKFGVESAVNLLVKLMDDVPP